MTGLSKYFGDLQVSSSSIVLALTPRIKMARATEIYCLGWTILAILLAAVCLGAQHCGLAFTDSQPTVIAVGVLLSVSLIFYGIFGRASRVGEMVRYLALWIAIFPVGRAFTYVSASLGYPLIDARLEGFDKAFGFDWLTWFNYVNAHSVFRLVLASAYARIGMLIILSIIYFSHRGESHRNNELLFAAIFSLILTGVISGILPAAGAFEHYGVADAQHGVHLHDLHAIRDGTMQSIAMEHIQGIVTLPSYHTVLAILLTYIYRKQRRILSLVLPFNLIVLLATLSEGGHHLADLLAGGVVAAFSLWIIERTGLAAVDLRSKYPPAEPGALDCEPLKAA
jgi:hypothetical protein